MRFRGRHSLAALILVALPAFGCGDTRPSPDATAAGEVPSRAGSDSGTTSSSPRAATPPGAPATDVVLITIDTLRSDVLGFAGHPSMATPALDRLATAGRVYSHAFAHNVVTLPSHANILTGLYPHQHGVRENSGFVLGDDVSTLATMLGKAGYRTAAFVGAYPLDSRYGLDRGFDVYDDTYTAGAKQSQLQFAERRGDQVVAAAQAWWQQAAGTKRFLWLHLYDPHAPYEAPEPFASRFPTQPYIAEVAAVDAYLAPLLDAFANASKPPLIVFTSDHGEGLGDHGEQTHGLFAYNATLGVPLVLAGPGIAPGRDDRLAGHVDIVPTLLPLLGLPTPDGLSGHSLVAPAADERTVYFEALSTYFNRGWAPLRGLIEGRDKVISLPLPELYDLADDPRETNNVLNGQRRRYRALLDALPDEQPWPPGQRTVPPEEVQRLRSLGYLASASTAKSTFGPEDDPKRLIDLDTKLHRMIDAYVRGRYDEAGRLARAVIAERPDMSTGHEHLALVLRAKRRPMEAIDALQAAIADGVTTDSIVRQLAATLAEVGQSEEAIKLMRPLAAKGDPATLNILASALSDVGQHQEALSMLQGVLAQEPANTETLESLGVLYLRLQQPRRAIEHLERALSLSDNLVASWNSLGVARAFAGDPAGAINAWERAVALDPLMIDALFNMGLTAAQMGDRARAKQALERYITTAPPDRFAADIARARQVLAGLGS